jgi:PAS domain S-box-containing protein
MPVEPTAAAALKGSTDDLLDAAPCGFLVFGEDGTVRLVNQTLLDMLGYRREAVVGRHVERLLTIGSRIFYQTHWFPLLRLHGSAEEVFLMLRGASGEDIGVIVNGVRRERHDAVEYHCVLIQVRERQKYERELLEAKRAAERARSELETQQRELRQAYQVLEAQAQELTLHQRQLQEQAEELWVINDALRARSEEAEHLRTVAEEANQAKSAFLAVMSHELRTPLNAIAGYLELLEMGIHGPVNPAQLDVIGRIARSERHLLRLINEVLNLSRIEAGHVEYLMENVRAAELVAGVAPMIEPQLKQKGVDFSVDVPPDLVVTADLEKGQQVLLNLLSNAIKFTPDGGRIDIVAVRCAEPAGHLCLRVSDTGIGIPPDKLETIFHPFVQVDATRTRTTEGSGLGLAISRDLARGMGGELTVESVPGRGSTFTLILPLAPEPGS